MRRSCLLATLRTAALLDVSPAWANASAAYQPVDRVRRIVPDPAGTTRRPKHQPNAARLLRVRMLSTPLPRPENLVKGLRPALLNAPGGRPFPNAYNRVCVATVPPPPKEHF